MKKETPEQKRQRLLQAAKASVSSAYAGEEHSVIQAINAYNEIERMRNQAFERLEEWYSMHFPEARIGSQSAYAKLVLEFGKNKKRADVEALRAIVGDKAQAVRDAIEKSIGHEPTDEEYEALKQLAQVHLSLFELEKGLDEYLGKTTKKIMPNISYLIEYKIAAELLAKAGSMERLAVLPASTVQLLGAEKALFKHIKYGVKAPKYGVLFKLAVISTAPKTKRGRLARMYATKISIAARADAMTKNFIAERLKESIDKATKKILSSPDMPRPMGHGGQDGQQMRGPPRGGPQGGHRGGPRGGPRQERRGPRRY